MSVVPFALEGFEMNRFTASSGRTRDVYRSGTGPAVIIIHEIPGITPLVAEFARRISRSGMTAVLPSLLGTAGRPMTVAYALSSLTRACVSMEFTLLALNKTSPIVDYLRDLAKHEHEEHGGPGVGTQLLTVFYGAGQVDTSRYTPNVVSFAPSPTQGSIAKDLLGTMLGVALLAMIWLVVLAIRIRRRGGTGRKTGAWIRSAGPIVFGLGGWFLGALLVLRFLPSLLLDDQLLAVVSVALPIWLGVYAGWVRTDTTKAMRAKGIGAAGVGAVVGAEFGFHMGSGLMALITSIIGAAVVSNLSLLVLDIRTERAASRGTAAPVVDLSETELLEPALH